jgi:hypothetical protein
MRKEDQWNKQGSHEISGDGSCQISAYKLPSTDQDKERRNFPGYETHTPGEALMNEISDMGTTETRKGQGMNHPSGELKRRFK